MLTEAPMLTQLESGKEFVVYSDASLSGLGCVLMQEAKVIACTSRQLKSYKKIYLTYEMNLQQRRWLKLLKDYDLIIDNLQGKANIVVDDLI
ncbi:CCHC-type integrase [Gossypium australe]|uniref:CCHC-type integrase n=1 Tax=Gossypium australe TaxID=47621 RepID=A0A5B6VL86_9ROSI|nr:CCHC-type integrase [Gossypium australe]